MDGNSGEHARKILTSKWYCGTRLLKVVNGKIEIIRGRSRENTTVLMDDRFCYYLRVRYCECDAQKVVFNAHYGNYVGLAANEFLRFLPVDQDLVDGNLDYQLVKQTLQWKSPARFDQVLGISVSIKHVGSTSFTIDTDIRIAGEERVIASAETVRVLLDAKTMTKKPISAALREAMEKGALGVVVDHAGYLRR
jgi:acyl-CoA thioester hydrolase